MMLSHIKKANIIKFISSFFPLLNSWENASMISLPAYLSRVFPYLALSSTFTPFSSSRDNRSNYFQSLFPFLLVVWIAKCGGLILLGERSIISAVHTRIRTVPFLFFLGGGGGRKGGQNFRIGKVND